LTALNGFGPCLLNPTEQAVARCSSSPRLGERCDGGNQGSQRDNKDAHDHEKFEQREGTFWRRPFHAFSTIVLRATPSEQRRREIMAGKTGFEVERSTAGGLFLSRTQGLLRKLGAKVPKTLNNNCSCLQPASARKGKRRHMGPIRKFRPPLIDKCLSATSVAPAITRTAAC